MLDSTSDIADFARDVLGRPLYPYQAEIAAAILASIRGGHGRIFTVMIHLKVSSFSHGDERCVPF